MPVSSAHFEHEFGSVHFNIETYKNCRGWSLAGNASVGQCVTDVSPRSTGSRACGEVNYTQF